MSKRNLPSIRNIIYFFCESCEIGHFPSAKVEKIYEEFLAHGNSNDLFYLEVLVTTGPFIFRTFEKLNKI